MVTTDSPGRECGVDMLELGEAGDEKGAEGLPQRLLLVMGAQVNRAGGPHQGSNCPKYF